jgi:hypothetical protein
MLLRPKSQGKWKFVNKIRENGNHSLAPKEHYAELITFHHLGNHTSFWKFQPNENKPTTVSTTSII